MIVGRSEVLSIGSSGYMVVCWPETVSAESPKKVVEWTEITLSGCSDGRDSFNSVLLTGPSNKDGEMNVAPVTELGFVCTCNSESVTDTSIEDDEVDTLSGWTENTVGTSTFTDEVPSVSEAPNVIWNRLWEDWFWKGVVDGLYK